MRCTFPGRSRSSSRSCTTRRRTTFACTPGCRRRRSTTPASRRSRRPRTPRTSTTSTSSPSPTSGTTSSPPAHPPSSSTSARTATAADVTARVALLGHPVAHSLSPRMQNAAFAAAGLDWAYEARDVEDVVAAVRALRDEGFAGANVTIPHKQAVVPACDEADGDAVNAPPVRDEILVRPVAGQVVVDLAYGPEETALVAAARAAGCDVVDGLEALVRQGAASFRLWTGVDAPVAVMRRAVRSPA